MESIMASTLVQSPVRSPGFTANLAMKKPVRSSGPTANQRLKHAFASYVWAAIALSAGVHYLVLSWGSFVVPDFSLRVSPPLQQIEIQRELQIPPPPQSIPRPAIPIVSTRMNIDQEITIGSVLIRDNPIDRLPPPPTPTTVDISEQPVFTPYSVSPELKNGADLQRALERSYPRAYKEAGIGGTTLLWIFINETGEVRNTRVVSTSGYEELDQVAREVMHTVAKFSPAYNRDMRVPVWIQIPVTFKVADPA
jgi:TonB family protein